jgi:hypothetical protein
VTELCEAWCPGRPEDCELPKDHEGDHRATVTWDNWEDS